MLYLHVIFMKKLKKRLRKMQNFIKYFKFDTILYQKPESESAIKRRQNYLIRKFIDNLE